MPITQPLRRLLGATAVLAVSLTTFTACSSDSADSTGATPLRVALAWIPSVEYGGFWLADSEGYYTDEGLDIEWIPGGPEAPTVEATVAAGGAEVGIESTFGQMMQ